MSLSCDKLETYVYVYNVCNIFEIILDWTEQQRDKGGF